MRTKGGRLACFNMALDLWGGELLRLLPRRCQTLRLALWPLRKCGTFLARKWSSNSPRPGQDDGCPERPPSGPHFLTADCTPERQSSLALPKASRQRQSAGVTVRIHGRWQRATRRFRTRARQTRDRGRSTDPPSACGECEFLCVLRVLCVSILLRPAPATSPGGGGVRGPMSGNQSVLSPTAHPGRRFSAP